MALAILELGSSPTLPYVQGAGNFFLGEVGVVAELGNGDVGPGGLVELGADALQ